MNFQNEVGLWQTMPRHISEMPLATLVNGHVEETQPEQSKLLWSRRWLGAQLTSMVAATATCVKHLSRPASQERGQPQRFANATSPGCRGDSNRLNVYLHIHMHGAE